MLQIESRDLGRLAASVRGLDKTVKRDLNKRIRTVAEPIARKVRNAALQLPADTGGKRERLSAKKIRAGQSLGMRKGLASAVEVRSRNGKNPGVRIVVSRSMFARQTGKSATLPRYVEGLRRKPWRHPLFGNREVWITQRKRPFLLPTVLPYKAKVREQILNQYEDTVTTALTRHGLRVR